jgi:MFS family permease
LVLGLFAGVWVDRQRRRPLLIASDYGRAAVLTVVPIAAITGFLSIELLIVVALLTGTLTMIFDISSVSFLPSVVRRDDLTGANSRLEASYAVAQASGPGLGGVLVGIVGAPITLLFDAVSFLLSGLLLQTVRSSEPAADMRRPREPRRIASDIRTGVTALARHPLLRATAAAGVTMSLFGWAFLSVYLLFLTRDLSLGPGTIGIILTLGGLGSAAGALLAGPLARRGVGRVMLWSQVANTLGSLAVPLAIFAPHLALPMLAISEVVQWGALTLFGVLQLSLRQAIVPGALQGRVTASHRVLVTGGAALGGLLGGWLGSSIGLGPTLAVCALGMGFSVLWIAVSPVPKLARMDDAID